MKIAIIFELELDGAEAKTLGRYSDSIGDVRAEKVEDGDEAKI